MHLHIGTLEAIKVFLMVIVVGFFWRLGALYWSDSPIGKSMAFLY